MTQRHIQYGVMPPKSNGAFVTDMENGLATYALPYDARLPVLCLDEQPVQLLNETRRPIMLGGWIMSMSERGQPVCSCLLSPFGGWCRIRVRKHRTKVDWAIELAHTPMPTGSSVREDRDASPRNESLVDGP